ncbi:MAG: phospho-sugar mutase [Waddliaceae bacterium]
MVQRKITLDPVTQKNVEHWLQGDFDEDTKSTIRRLLQDNPKEIVDAFYTQLSFGTGGMRGVMGVGTNRMNHYTVRLATQGLANYLLKQPLPEHGHAVLIGYDSRHNSRLFAEEAAKVLAGNGIRVFLFSELRPTPLVSFGCRLKKCDAAIMITASHNTSNYNGYKVYGGDGGQVAPPHDAMIIAEVEQLTEGAQVKSVSDLSHPLIAVIETEVDDAYINAIKSYPFYPEDNLRDGRLLHVVYTSFHGTGITMVPKVLKQWGFTQLDFVDKQIIPDGDFPTVIYPNPEDHDALKLGIETMQSLHADLLIGTDPDADRVGVVCQKNNNPQFLSGNEVACLCVYHICQALTEQKRMPKKAAFVKSIGTTELFRAIVESFGGTCYDVLIGFKYIAEKIHQWEHDPQENTFIFGAEESYGYLLGTHSRDKDAVVTSALICEAALHCKRQGKTLQDLLYTIYHQFGVYVDQLLSVVFEESKEGRGQMARGIERLQHHPPTHFLGIDVEVIEDFSQSIATNLKTKKTTSISLPQSNILRFRLADGSKLMVRPSGTEPKIKIYSGVVKKEFATLPEALKACEEHAADLSNEIKKMLVETS